MDIVIKISHVECYRRNLMIWLRLLDEVKLHMDASRSDLASGPGIIDILRQEDRIIVPGAKRLQLLEDTEEFRCNLGEVEPGVDLHNRSHHLGGNLTGDKIIHAAGKFIEILLLQSQSGGVDMPPEVFKQIGAALDGLVQVESGYAPGGTGHKSVGLGKHHRRLVIRLDKPCGDNADHSLVPFGVIYNCSVLPGQTVPGFNHLKSHLSNLPVNILALVVILIYLLADEHRCFGISSLQQLHRKPSGLDTAGRIDTGPYLEYNILYRDVSRLAVGKIYHGKQALARILVQLLQAEMSQHAVLVHHCYKIGRDADHKQVKKRYQTLERHTVLCRIGLHELESHTAARKVIKRIMAILALGIQDSNSLRQ